MVSNRIKFVVLGPVLEAVNRFIPGRPHRLLADSVDATGRVLEVCSGTGYLARMIAVKHRDVAVDALDVSAESLDLGRRLTRRSGLSNVDFVEADASAMPFDDGTFDTAVSCFGLHEIPSTVRPAALREIHRVLRPGGRLAVVDLDRPVEWWRPVWEVGVRVGEKPDAAEVLGPGLADALTAAGFDAVTRQEPTRGRPFQVVDAVRG